MDKDILVAIAAISFLGSGFLAEFFRKDAPPKPRILAEMDELTRVGKAIRIVGATILLLSMLIFLVA